MRGPTHRAADYRRAEKKATAARGRVRPTCWECLGQGPQTHRAADYRCANVKAQRPRVASRPKPVSFSGPSRAVLHLSETARLRRAARLPSRLDRSDPTSACAAAGPGSSRYRTDFHPKVSVDPASLPPKRSRPLPVLTKLATRSARSVPVSRSEPPGPFPTVARRNAPPRFLSEPSGFPVAGSPVRLRGAVLCGPPAWLRTHCLT